MSDEPFYHIIAKQSGNRTKVIFNKSHEEVLFKFVVPFLQSGTITAKWGSTLQTYQVLELLVYKTKKRWDKKSGETFDKFLGSARNIFSTFEKKAKGLVTVPTPRVFLVMPIQGEKSGTQDEQRIYQEYDKRFYVIEKMLSKMNCVAIRIDKEYPIGELVKRIKTEISLSKFVIADMTDERPSCYFEAGYAEAMPRQVIYVASKESVIMPGKNTKIHFDIHNNILFFTNHKELEAKLKKTIERNSEKLFKENKQVVSDI